MCRYSYADNNFYCILYAYVHILVAIKFRFQLNAHKKCGNESSMRIHILKERRGERACDKINVLYMSLFSIDRCRWYKTQYCIVQRLKSFHLAWKTVIWKKEKCYCFWQNLIQSGKIITGKIRFRNAYAQHKFVSFHFLYIKILALELTISWVHVSTMNMNSANRIQ